LRLLGRLAQLLDHILLGGEHLVAGLVIGADPHVLPLLDEVADMAHGSLDGVLPAEELLEGLGFSGAFDDEQVLSHSASLKRRGPPTLFLVSLGRHPGTGRGQSPPSAFAARRGWAGGWLP